jgi:drug/metabolite transporter (DMT)-like permease
MGEWFGVGLGLASSALGGSAAAVTRYLVGSADPITLALLRFGIGFLCVLPVALALRVRWPRRADWPAAGLLGLSFFGVFFVFYNIAMSYTSAARASLALSTLPLQTMVVGALLGREPLGLRKGVGVAIAVAGVGAALAAGLEKAPEGAWRGELIMAGAVLCMAFYNVFSRELVQRSSALGFLTFGMGTGALALLAVAVALGQLAALGSFGAPEWAGALYLGIGGGALAFVLWVMALQHASPTRVANTMAINPLTAALLAAVLVQEPLTWTWGSVLSPCWPGLGSPPPSPLPAARTRDRPRSQRDMSEGFASRLRWWRARRGLSQLDLAMQAGVSQRHVSFLDCRRAAHRPRWPSRLRIAWRGVDGGRAVPRRAGGARSI